MTAQTTEDLLERVCDHVRGAGLLGTIEGVLSWDDRCSLPTAAGDYRGDQITLLTGMIHDRLTDPRLGEWLDTLNDSPLAADPHSDSGTIIRQLRRSYQKRTRLPKELVEAIARATVRGQQVWQEARRADDFAMFRGELAQIVRLKREQAEAQGYEESPYDALLDDYEQGERTSNVGQVLRSLREGLSALIEAIAGAERRPNVALLERDYPVADQQTFGKAAAAAIGFDFARGRLDVTAHPFCTTLGPHDCRLTTRYSSRHFPGGFFGILHEAGHGLYEQGLRTEFFGLPPGETISLGIHESQSRMWENFVGRSRAFWQAMLPEAQQVFPAALGNVSLDDFYFAINDVRPSLIRVEADEATYNLHILIRFELEQALIAGELDVDDLPEAWNAAYRQTLGVESPTNADGVLQDIHWSAGLIGYFPTYSLGNLYAAQFYQQAERDLGSLDALYVKRHFAPLREWLAEKIHRVGQCYSAAELVERVTGRPLESAPLLEHLSGKLKPLYGL